MSRVSRVCTVAWVATAMVLAGASHAENEPAGTFDIRALATEARQAALAYALDFQKQVNVADYLVTNDTDFEAFILARHSSAKVADQLGLAVDHHPLLTLPEDIRRVIFASDAAYLQTTFEQVRSEYGSVDGYLRECVGLTDADRQRLNDTMLA